MGFVITRPQVLPRADFYTRDELTSEPRYLLHLCMQTTPPVVYLRPAATTSANKRQIDQHRRSCLQLPQREGEKKVRFPAKPLVFDKPSEVLAEPQSVTAGFPAILVPYLSTLSSTLSKQLLSTIVLGLESLYTQQHKYLIKAKTLKTCLKPV